MNLGHFLPTGGQTGGLRANRSLLLLCWGCMLVPCAEAQNPSRPTVQSSESGRPAESGRPSSSRPDGASKPEGKPADGKEGGKDQEKKEGSGSGAKVIERPTEPTAPPDPKELTVRPADDGKLAFNFRNQPWVSLLEWFAEIAEQPLDWRELPGDHVNLASSGRYTLDEVFDLLNRHLLARGFTMVQLDDGLMVLKTEGINPALVPRVDAEQLTVLQPHQFVCTSMDAGWLSAEALTEELKPMISSNGRLVALKTTNRIEAMDAAINLLQVSELLQQELSSDARDHLAPEFELRYIAAEDAKEMLEQFLGIEEKESAPMTPQQMQQMQQMRSRSSSNGQQPPAQEKKPEISIVANTRRNSILVQAPADRLAIAQEFIKRIDVPSDSIVSLADVESRVQAFRLVSLDPEKLIEIVQDMNILEPSTRIRVDSDSNAVIVSGAAADRFIIKSLIERLDGSGREFYVLPIRYRDPRAVAESISFLMGKDKEDDDNGRSSRYSYFGYSSRREEPKQEDEFRVTADVQFRQVLVWANEIELEEVRSLLVKLGEIPPEEGSRRSVRVLDVDPTPETYEYLKRLKEQFRQLSPNEVELPPQELFKEPNQRPQSEGDSADKATEEAEEADGQEKANDNGDGKQRLPSLKKDPLARQAFGHGRFFTAAMQSETAQRDAAQETETDREAGIDPAEIDPRTIRSVDDFDRLFGNRSESARAAEDQPPAGAASENSDPAPLQITVGPDGRIVVRSTDTDALDRLESLMLQLTPPKRPYRVFYIEHASAYWVQLNLEDYFSEEDEEEDSSSRRYYFYDYQSDDDSDAPMGLDQQKKMRMISDDDTNTIVVSGASPEQLRTIEELIELWDVPQSPDSRTARYTKLIQVKYSRAEKIAETVKDAYRDLLSSNDKTFSQGNRGGGGSGGGRSTQRNDAERSRDGGGSELFDQGRGGQSGGSNFDFKGKLAIGVDDVGNTLLVTAEGEDLLQLVVGMIEQLDVAAQPQGDVQVHKVAGTVSVSALEAALRVLSSEEAPATPSSPARPPEPPQRGRPEPGRGDGGNGGEPSR